MLPLSGLRLMPRKWATCSEHESSHFHKLVAKTFVTIVATYKQHFLNQTHKRLKTVLAQNAEIPNIH